MANDDDLQGYWLGRVPATFVTLYDVAGRDAEVLGVVEEVHV